MRTLLHLLIAETALIVVTAKVESELDCKKDKVWCAALQRCLPLNNPCKSNGNSKSASNFWCEF